MERDSKSGLLERLRPSPNDEVDLLEQHLGITFEKKPAKIKISRINFVLNFTALKKISRNLGNAVGLYLCEENTVLVIDWLSNELHTSLHENMHAFVYQINPQLVIWRPEAELRGKKFSDFTQEEGEALLKDQLHFYLVARTVDEGIAEWAAAEVMLRMGTKPAVDPHDYYISMYTKSSKKHHNFSPYLEGHIFVRNAMDALTRKGLNVNDALTLIIKNPPRRLEQLQLPEMLTYSWQLLSLE